MRRERCRRRHLDPGGDRHDACVAVPVGPHGLIADRLEQWWEGVRPRFLRVKTLVINLNNGPENHSRRSQLMKRVVGFARRHGLVIRPAYYPPSHSNIQPDRAVLGHPGRCNWSGSLLDSAESVLGFARSMTWQGKHPVVSVTETIYAQGVRLKPEEDGGVGGIGQTPADAGEGVRADSGGECRVVNLVQAPGTKSAAEVRVGEGPRRLATGLMYRRRVSCHCSHNNRVAGLPGRFSAMRRPTT